MAEYLSVEEARSLPGLRLVVTAHVPGLWSEAAKSIFDAKGIPYRLVEQVVAGENLALKEWTAQTSGPCAVHEDERPRAMWIDQLYLAERLAPEPRLIPADMDERATMFGLCNELAGENGFGWNLRMRATHGILSNPGMPPSAQKLGSVLAQKYFYDPALVDGARLQMIGIVERLRDRLAAQQAVGRRYFIGDALSALDIYWSAFAGAIDPLPPHLCPNMPDDMRMSYTDPELKAIGGQALFAHRDRVYREHLKLPMDF